MRSTCTRRSGIAGIPLTSACARPKSLQALVSCTLLAVLLSFSNASYAVDLYWDANGATSGTGGAGNWLGTSLWRNGSDVGSLQNWADATNAFLGDVSGIVNIGTSGSTSVSAANVSVTTTGYTIRSTNTSRTFSATGLTLANSVALTLNIDNSGSTWTVGGITFGTSSSLTIAGNATAANTNRINLNVLNESFSGGAIELAGTDAGLTGFVATNTGVTIGTPINNNSSTSATMIGATSGNGLTLSSTAVISGSAGLQFSAGPSGGAGSITLNSQNTYTGATTFNSTNSGIIKLGVNNALPTSTAVTMAASSGNGGVLDLNGKSQEIASLTSGVGGGSITNGAAGTGGSLKVSGSASPAAFGLVITDGAGTVSLERAGAGALNLTAANTYTGGTTVSGGLLSVNNTTGSGTGTGSVNVNTGGTLGGSGTISGATNINLGGTLAPGNSVGKLTFTGPSNNVTMVDDSELKVELGAPTTPGTTFDQVVLDGSSKIFTPGGATLRLIGLSGISSGGTDTYTVVSAVNGASVAAASYFQNLDGTPMDSEATTYSQSGMSFTINYETSFIAVTFSAVPEPSMLGLCIVPLLFRRRARK